MAVAGYQAGNPRGSTGSRRQPGWPIQERKAEVGTTRGPQRWAAPLSAARTAFPRAHACAWHAQEETLMILPRWLTSTKTISPRQLGQRLYQAIQTEVASHSVWSLHAFLARLALPD